MITNWRAPARVTTCALAGLAATLTIALAPNAAAAAEPAGVVATGEPGTWAFGHWGYDGYGMEDLGFGHPRHPKPWRLFGGEGSNAGPRFERRPYGWPGDRDCPGMFRQPCDPYYCR
ncbi:hypothetical protein [Nocardia sp. NPDC051832]|uniref:hypothetical protein n=1 Tax=Nocardia sp. NPDC051832 TaxID=3155673 RepID=UPI00343ABF8C